MRRQLSVLLWRILAPTLEVAREEGRKEVRAAVQDELALWDNTPAGSVMPARGAADLIRRALESDPPLGQ